MSGVTIILNNIEVDDFFNYNIPHNRISDKPRS